MSLPGIENPSADYEKQLSPLDNDNDAFQIESSRDRDFGVLDSELDIATHIISIHDDPTLNPWTLRAFVVGFGLSAFGGALGNSSIYFLHIII